MLLLMRYCYCHKHEGQRKVPSSEERPPVLTSTSGCLRLHIPDVLKSSLPSSQLEQYHVGVDHEDGKDYRQDTGPHLESLGCILLGLVPESASWVEQEFK